MCGKPILILFAGATLAGLTACKDRKEAAKEELKEKGYDLTPEAFFRAAESDDSAMLAELLKHGIAADTRNPAGDTALHAAAVAGMKKSADFLLEKGVPVDVTGAEGRTPLMTAVLNGSPEMARYLLSRRADPRKKDAQDFTPLMLAVTKGRPGMVAELAPHDRENLDAALLVASLEGRAAAIDELTKYGASIYARMDDGRTALMLAAENGNLEAVEMLLDIGANRFSMDDQGRIAADLARGAGHEELALRLAEAPAEEEFGLEEPADLGAEMMALMAAADAGAGMVGGEPSADPGNGGSPAGGNLSSNQPVPRQGGGASSQPPRRTAPSLEGRVIESSHSPAAGGSVAVVSSPLVMRAYRQKELPLRVESVSGQSAKLRLAGGGVAEVSQGAAVPGSRLSVIRVQRRMQQLKDSPAGPVEVSVVELEDSATGRRRELVSGLAPTAHDPVALVEDGSGNRYVARAGQKFRSEEGEEFTVIDVRPNQMVIENRSKREVITVPLRGPRG
jgi:ankyrin repeat protein